MSIRQTDEVLFSHERVHNTRFSLAVITKNSAKCTLCTVVCVCVRVVLAACVIVAVTLTVM